MKKFTKTIYQCLNALYGTVTNRNAVSKKLIVLLLLLTWNGLIGCEKAEPEPIPEPEPLQNTKLLACWGDSLTEGVGSTPGNSYPSTLASLSKFEVYNGGIGGQTSTQIKTRMLAAKNKKEDYVIIWAGRNNYDDTETIKADIAQMVASLGHKKYFILSVLNADFGDHERKGGYGYHVITGLNNDLKKIYGVNYLDVRSYLISKANTTAQDKKDQADDLIPTSLRSDPVHLNNEGYVLLAKYIYENFKAIE